MAERYENHFARSPDLTEANVRMTRETAWRMCNQALKRRLELDINPTTNSGSHASRDNSIYKIIKNIWHI